jgi:cell division protein FtsQ
VEEAMTATRTTLPPRLRLALAIVVVGLLLGGGWLWLRDSSLVAIQQVTVTGVSGPDAGAIRSALTSAARGMTTLDVRTGQLHTAVAPFPEVKRLDVSTQFPHGVRIRVIEQLPVAAVEVAGRRIAVASDGTLLHDVPTAASLPLIPLTIPPGGPRVTDPSAVNAVALLAAAPDQLLSRISQVTTVAGHGLVAQVRGGPSIYFGAAAVLRAKWAAATAVLADRGSAGAAYIDVTDPVRPVAGAGAAGANAVGSAGSSAAAGSSATAGSGSSPGG